MHPTPTTDLARTLRVETPEQVDLGFEIADLGSRFMALVLDTLVLLLALTALMLLLLWAGLRAELAPLLQGWGMAAAILVWFLVIWGYFLYWEGYHNGRTPGKRWAGLRVIHDGGHPLTVRGAAVRNLLRIVDVQPLFTCMIGGVAMTLHPRTQRLGDMAAATLVIRDRGASELTEEELAALAENAPADPPRLPDESFTALDRFAARRSELGRDARDRLVQRLTEALGPYLSGDGADEERLVLLWEEETMRRAGAAGPASSPLATGLARARAQDWLEYRRLVDRASRRGLETLESPDIERFAALYRSTAADLARARTYGASWPLIFSLERWVGAGHNLLYRPEGRSWRGLVAWLRHGFPALVRARIAFVLLAAALLFLPGLGVFTAVRANPALARDLVPHNMIERAETAPERMRRGGEYVEIPEVFMPVMSTGVITNNVQVTFFAFAGGILAGLGTAFILVVNGISLGAVFALFHNHGAGRLLWEFVAPHGVIELTAICVAGGAGLLLGSALLFPGRQTRARALADRAREAISLVAGTTLLLVLAGLLEGFVSPAPIPAAAKLVIAATVAAGLLAYLAAGGRGQQPARGPDGWDDDPADPASPATAVPGT